MICISGCLFPTSSSRAGSRAVQPPSLAYSPPESLIAMRPDVDTIPTAPSWPTTVPQYGHTGIEVVSRVRQS